MINPDSVNSLAAAILPARGDSGNGEQKRAAWLLQMERALLAANQVRVTPDTAQAGLPGQSPLSTSTRAVENAAPHEKNRVLQDGGAAAVAGSNSQPLASNAQAPVREANQSGSQAGTASATGALQATGGRVAEGASDGISQPLQTAQVGKTAAQTDAVADGSDGSGTLMGMGSQASDGTHLQQNDLQLNGLQPVPVSAMTALAAGLLPALNPYQSLQADGPAIVASAAVAGVRAASPAGLWGLTQANPQGKPLAAQSGEVEAAELPATGGEAPDAEPFAERQLHLYQGADGVQAWIRDADLSQMRAQLVAQALNNELNAAGLKLKTLTVNGRKLDGSSIGTGGAAEDGAEALADYAMPEIGASRAAQN